MIYVRYERSVIPVPVKETRQSHASYSRLRADGSAVHSKPSTYCEQQVTCFQERIRESTDIDARLVG